MLREIRNIAMVLCGSALAAQSQTTNVTGNITGLKDKELVVNYYLKDKAKADTVKIKDGKFTWKAAIAEPQKVAMMIGGNFFQFFVESGKIGITGTADLQELKIRGSKVQDENEAYEGSLKDLQDQEALLYPKWGKGSPQEQEVLESKIDDLRAQRRERTDQYILQHPGSAVSLSLVTEKAMMGNYGAVKKSFELLDKSLQGTEEGKRLAERIAVLKRSGLGEEMLNFTQNDVGGKPVKFDDFKGKYVFVDFWASWCGPCRAENPNVLKAYETYKDKNFTVIGISLDEHKEKWEKAIADDKMPWTQLSDLKGFNNEVSTYYGIMGIPSNLLIDPQGKIIAKDLRGATLQKKLAELFAN